MIKNIVFDFGGVILLHRKEIFAYLLGEIFPSNEEKLVKVWEEQAGALQEGNISSKDLLQKCKALVNDTRPIEQLMKMWKELYFEEAKGVNYELLDLIEKLKKHYKVFLFTDTIDIHDEVNKDRGIYERFDGVIKSFEERLSKHSGKRHILTYSGNLI